MQTLSIVASLYTAASVLLCSDIVNDFNRLQREARSIEIQVLDIKAATALQRMRQIPNNLFAANIANVVVKSIVDYVAYKCARYERWMFGSGLLESLYLRALTIRQKWIRSRLKRG